MARESTARKLDTDEGAYSEKDLQSLKERDTNAADVTAQKKKILTLGYKTREAIDKAGGSLSKVEKEALEAQLETLSRESDHKGLEKFHDQVTTMVARTQELTRQFMGIIDADANKPLLSQKETEELRREFQSKRTDDKLAHIEKFNEVLEELRKARAEVVKITGGSQKQLDEFADLSRKDKTAYLEDLKKTAKDFEDLIKKAESMSDYDADDLKSRLTRFRECGNLKDQKDMLKDLRDEVEGTSQTNVQKVFKSFPEQHQSKFAKEFKKAKTGKDRLAVVERMRESLIQEYIKLVQKTPNYSAEEKSEMTGSFRTLASIDPKQIKMLMKMIEDFPKYDAKAKEFTKTFESTPAEVQAQYRFKEARFSQKEKIAKECEEHMKLIDTWQGKLKAAQQGKLLCAISAEKYVTDFAKLDVNGKRKAIERSTLDDPLRKQTLSRFEKGLPQEVQDQNKHFYDMRLRDRVSLVDQLEQEGAERDKLGGIMKKKIQKMAKEDRTLAPKSAAEYEKWVDGLSLDELKKFHKKSELDDPARQVLMVEFASLPEQQQKDHANFYNLDMTGRMELLGRIMPDKGAHLMEKISRARATQEQTAIIEKQARLSALYESVELMVDQDNVEGELELRKKVAQEDPDNPLNNQRIEELMKIINPDAATIAETIDKTATESEYMRRVIEMAAMEQMIGRRARLSEERHGGKRGIRSRLGAQGDEFSALDKEYYDYTGGQEILDRRTGKAAGVIEFNTRRSELMNATDIEAMKRQLKPERERVSEETTSNLDKYTYKNREGRELTGTELDQKLNDDAANMAAKIIEIHSGKRLARKPSPEVVAATKRQLEEYLVKRRLAA